MNDQWHNEYGHYPHQGGLAYAGGMVFTYCTHQLPLQWLYTAMASGTQTMARYAMSVGPDHKAAETLYQLEQMVMELTVAVGLGDGQYHPSHYSLISQLPEDDLVEVSAAYMGVRRLESEPIAELWERLTNVAVVTEYQ